ncbi:GPP34 family phosphoprotein [Saccharopolyspora sp. WRP15-2]|uniref:GPP34 family phosphoprotein n=1 Tax=Saccharopolyspora oryzae TaxID=2997343 RepID=A0ABT4V4B8_9PSEU|nr:GPP34 family phosphoprotein [Saccharopolyspora oryzae]MDA3628142.1 GPP34 family phosphoprotein [Saccharopolyspora oryzae]
MNAPRPLTLPEEFVLLAHQPSGTVQSVLRADAGCAAAELGDLALRGKLRIRTNKFEFLGIRVYRGTNAVELLDVSPTGLGWADALLDELARLSATRPVPVREWRQTRGVEAFDRHRAALVERGLLHHEPSDIPAQDRYLPHNPTRDALIAEIETAIGSHAPIGAHMLFRFDLANAIAQLRITKRGRWVMNRDRGIGPVADIPEDLRETSRVLTMVLPERSA